jgi:nucleoside-diphosphate-sugar epimerase
LEGAAKLVGIVAVGELAVIPPVFETNVGDADWRARRCLVTGASGFIGTALCRRLNAVGAEVWGVGRRSEGPANVRWLACDVTDRARVEDAMRTVRPDTVFHLASVVTGARKLDVVLPTLHANLTGLVNVALAANDRQCRRIVCVGSLQEPDQSLPAIPASPYAAAKYAASCYARMLAEVFDVPISIARLFMVFGPGQSDFTKVVPYVLSQLIAGRQASLSTGAHPFDWVFVEDACDALLAIASCESAIGCTVDVGTGALTPTIDVARGLGRRLNATHLLDVGAIADRVGEPIRAADTAATKALTGWEARVGLEEGLDRTVKWFERHLPAMPVRSGMT